MANDERAQFIIDQVTHAAREVKAYLPDIPVDQDDFDKINFTLKLFDRLLPIIVAAVIAEYKKQAGAS